MAIQRVEGQIKTLLRQVDTDSLTQDEKKAFVKLRRLAVDARLDIRDYELSETRDEQLKKMHAAKKCLTKLEKALLTAGMAFGPADIAQLSAQLAQIDGWLI